MISITKQDQQIEFVKKDHGEINSLLPFPKEKIEINSSVDFGEFFRIVVNSKELDKYHKYYGYPLRNKSLYAKCREWNDPINTKQTDIDWLVVFWKVIRSNEYIDFDPRFVGVELDGSKKIVSELDDKELIEFEFTPFHINSTITINGDEMKKRFTVREVLAIIFEKL